ncbi:MAG: hypothetical protein IJ242_07810 [Clostridia bacterium]|nr:hypothetical protein [Clostridia bacterium]
MGAVKAGIILIVLSLMTASSAFAEQDVPVWMTALSHEEGFEQTEGGKWLYQQTAGRQYTDGVLTFGLEAAVYEKTDEVLVCVFAELSGGQQITRMDFVIDEGVWSWHSVLPAFGDAVAFLGAPEADFLTALASAGSVEIRIHVLGRKMTAGFTGSELDDIRRSALLLQDVLEVVDISPDSTTGQFELSHPLHRSGSAALDTELLTD